MPAAETSSSRDEFPASPCIRVCALDAHDVCLGCRRTLDEIVAWPSMSAAEQRAVLRGLSQRRQAPAR